MHDTCTQSIRRKQCLFKKQNGMHVIGFTNGHGKQASMMASELKESSHCFSAEIPEMAHAVGCRNKTEVNLLALAVALKVL